MNDGASTLNARQLSEQPEEVRSHADQVDGSDGSLPVTISTIGSRPSSGGHWEHRGCPYLSPRVVDDARSTS